MASETNELTFVRCPTCRSLVPASASRCRICNATLEAGGEQSPTSGTASSAGRVRQKTLSASSEEVRNLVDGTSSSGAAASQPPPAPPSGRSAPDPLPPTRSAKPAASPEKGSDSTFDPLGAFLQDLDSEPDPIPAAQPRPMEPQRARSKPDKTIESLVDDLFGDDDDDDDREIEDLVGELLLDDGKPSAEGSASGDDEEDDEDDFDINLFDDPAFDELLETKKETRDEQPAQRPASHPDPLPPSPPRAPLQPKPAGPARPGMPPRQGPPAAQEGAARKVEPPRPPRSDERPQPPQQRQEQARGEAQRPPQQQRPQPPRHEQQRAQPNGENRQQPEPRRGDDQGRQNGEQRAQQQQQGERRPPAPPQQRPNAMVLKTNKGTPTPPPQTPRPEAKQVVQQPEPLVTLEDDVVEQPVKPPARPVVEPPQRPRENGQGQPDTSSRRNVAQGASEAKRHDAKPEQHSAERPQGGAPRMNKIKPGRLFGWLVSFENPDGRAIELRAGRFFVTGTSIRGSDLILEDQSISTPHALMSINEKGFLLQDLMSERGTFVRSKGDAQYRREEGIIDVQHGDWIRFGDVEFLVTIVPG